MFKIELKRDVSWPSGADKALAEAAATWERVIEEPLAPHRLSDGSITHSIRIECFGRKNLPAKVNAEARPTSFRLAAAPDNQRHLPASGQLALNLLRLKDSPSDAWLTQVLTHEIGHALGFGTIWVEKKLLKLAPEGPIFTGPLATKIYAQKSNGAVGVPVEAGEAYGLKHSHWHAAVAGEELMAKALPLWSVIGPITIASMADLGYGLREDGKSLEQALATLAAPLTRRDALLGLAGSFSQNFAWR